MRKTILLLVTMVLAVLLGSGMVLAAALSEVPDTGTIGANGRIWSIVHKGNSIYLGGAFTRITDKDGKSSHATTSLPSMRQRGA